MASKDMTVSTNTYCLQLNNVSVLYMYSMAEYAPQFVSNFMSGLFSDMGLFGHCPERDPFYTVVCEQCKALVKPQGLWNHIRKYYNLFS